MVSRKCKPNQSLHIFRILFVYYGQNSKGELLSTVSGVALCRCGASKNKPFCDGIHATIGFSTENKVGESVGSGEKKVIKDKRKIMLARRLQFMIIEEFVLMLLNA